MTESALRWVLLIVGIIILVVIYLLGKRSRTPQSSGTGDLVEQATQLDDDINVSLQTLDDSDDEITDQTLSYVQSLNAMVQEESETRVHRPRTVRQAEEKLDVAAVETDSTDTLKPATEVHEKLIVLHVAAHRPAVFTGEDILQASRELDLEFGARGMLHRPIERSGKLQSLFYVASMVKPGIIPYENLEQFSTPGLTLFLQLPGPEESLKSFNALWDCAQGLAALLDGEIQDEDHSTAVPQTIDHLREEIQLFSLRHSGAAKRSIN